MKDYVEITLRIKIKELSRMVQANSAIIKRLVEQITILTEEKYAIQDTKREK